MPANNPTKVMSGARFTPGPYYVGPESPDRYNEPYTEIRFDRQYSDGGKPTTYILARVIYPRTHPDTVGTLERQANAHLIAAAPDMYEALILLAGALIEHAPAEQAVIQQAQAVIARAEGR